MKVRVTTGSRLHFGLFRLPGQGQVGPASTRQYGGVGLIVEQPELIVCAEPMIGACDMAPGQIAAPPSCSERVRDIAGRVVSSYSLREKFRVQVECCPPQHVGLGTGTQLSLAIGLALTRAGDRTPELLDLAQRLGRGQRSALGIHGFMQGGFLVEAGKSASTVLSPLVARAEFPEEWRVLLVLPSGTPGRHGTAESRAFADLAQSAGSEAQCDALCRLTLLGMLPALLEKDLSAFGESLYEFNRRVGEMFHPVQGGIYSQPITEAIVSFLRQHLAGTGQSSWGPTVFAVAETDRAASLAELVRERFGLQEHEVIVTLARNAGVASRTA